HVEVDRNPYFGLSERHLSAALRASEESAASHRQPPEALLALWSREGSLRARFDGLRGPRDFGVLLNGATVSTPENARVLTRSFIFWNDLGIDHFVAHPPGAADNRPILNDTTVTDHERTYASAVQQLVRAGGLARDIAGDITSGLPATGTAAAGFVVTATE